jgi:damage-control phosphatase, subfamily I
MITYLDCIPCFLRQSLDTIRNFTDKEELHEQMIREILGLLREMDMSTSPPEMAQVIHKMIRETCGQADPYKEAKEMHNRLAADLLPALGQRVEKSEDPLLAAVKLAIAGNIIDLGAKHDLSESQVIESLEESAGAVLDNNVMSSFRRSVFESENILYLGDNAGEIVFDRLLLEYLPLGKVTYVVRGGPVINDATVSDAVFAGIPEVAEVMDNGFDAPGTILNKCSEEFQEKFRTADCIISKGQGNYETLSNEEAPIFFLLKAKCPVIANEIGCDVGSVLLLESQHKKASAGISGN